MCCLSQSQSTESLLKYFPDLSRVEPLLGSPVGLPEARSFYQLFGDREVPTTFLIIDWGGGEDDPTPKCSLRLLPPVEMQDGVCWILEGGVSGIA